jgi:hypothetical protein
MDEKNSQTAHRRMVARWEILRNQRRNNNSPGTGSAKGRCGSEPRSFSGSKSFSFASTVLSDIGITFGGSSAEGTGSYSAFVDPIVTIDPTFKNARGYSLIFSPNVPSYFAVGLDIYSGKFIRRISA